MTFTLIGILSSAGALGSTLAGYVAGGQNSGGVFSSVEKFLFSNDTNSVLAAGLSVARTRPGAFSSATHGYVAGGASPLNLSTGYTTVDKFDFASDARTTLATGLGAERFSGAGFESETAGYLGGGCVGGDSNNPTTTVYKFSFADDSRSTLASGLAAARRDAGSFSSTTHGYVAGGAESNSTMTATVYKWLFSNDSRSTLGTGLSFNTQGPVSFHSSTHGYVGGGLTTDGTGSAVTTVNKFAFSNDARTILGTGLSSARWGITSGFESVEFGYVSGGSLSNNTDVITTVDKLDFAVDTFSNVSAGLTSARRYATGFAA